MSVSTPQQCQVHLVSMSNPGDVSEIASLFDNGTLDPSTIIAVLGKTEGNGCVNDFTRAYAVAAVSTLLSARLRVTMAEISARVAIVMSGGTEGGLSPHFLIFAVTPGTAEFLDGLPSLAAGIGFTRPIAPEEIGRPAQIHATMDAVHAALTRARITEPADVHLVQIKCPLLTVGRINEARARGNSVATEDTYASMGLSRGASALGVALALGEISLASLREESVGADFHLWSGRASASAGIELMRSEILVLGNSQAWTGPLMIAHGVMQDAIDFPAIQRTLEALGLFAGGQVSAGQADRICAVLAKAEASRTGTIRGKRHIMSDDSDINATRHARALVGGVVAAALGRTDLFISGGAEHQGPDGGGPIAIIARKHAPATVTA
jgi:cyanuric acid amidohydrolase